MLDHTHYSLYKTYNLSFDIKYDSTHIKGITKRAKKSLEVWAMGYIK